MKNSRTAFLAGATGLVGSELLSRLLANDLYSQVHVLSRRPINTTHAKLDCRVHPFEQIPALDQDTPEFFQTQDVFCCLGTTIKTAGSKKAFEAVDYGHVLALAQTCIKHGAQRFFLVSAVGASPKSSNFYSQVKGRTEVAVSKLNFTAVYWVRPSLLLGQRDEHRPGEAWAQRLAPVFSPLLAGPLRSLRPVSAANVAAHIMRLAEVESPGQHITYPSQD